jgi:hypothetical protein
MNKQKRGWGQLRDVEDTMKWDEWCERCNYTTTNEVCSAGSAKVNFYSRNSSLHPSLQLPPLDFFAGNNNPGFFHLELQTMSLSAESAGGIFYSRDSTSFTSAISALSRRSALHQLASSAPLKLSFSIFIWQQWVLEWFSTVILQPSLQLSPLWYNLHLCTLLLWIFRISNFDFRMTRNCRGAGNNTLPVEVTINTICSQQRVLEWSSTVEILQLSLQLSPLEQSAPLFEYWILNFRTIFDTELL